MNQDQFVTASPSQFGGTFLSREIKKIEDTIDVKLAAIDEALLTALDKIIGADNVIQYQPKSLNDISKERPNSGDVDMNGKQLTNVGGIPDITESGITQYALFATNLATTIALDVANIALNTNYCGPLSATTSMKGKRITDVEKAQLVIPNDPDGAAKINQGVNYGNLIELALTTAPEDRSVYAAGDKKIIELGDALLYKDSDIRISADPLEANLLNVDPSVLQKYRSTAMNLKSVEAACVVLEPEERKHFVAQSKQIKLGSQATDPKDFVTLDQVVHQEEGLAEWINTDPVSEDVQRDNFVFEDDRIVFVSAPKKPLGNQFSIFQDSETILPTRFISASKQVANIGYVDSAVDKCLKIDQDIDLKQHRVRNSLAAEEPNDCVINSQCKARSGKKDTGEIDYIGPIIGGIAGLLTGAVSGGISAIFGASLSGGLTAVGSLAGGASGAASGALAGGLSIGSAQALDAAKDAASDGMKQLIDNVVDDMANQVPPIDTGMIVSSVTGFQQMLSAVANAQTSLFAII